MNRIGTVLEETKSYDVINVSPAVPHAIRRGVTSMQEAETIANDFLKYHDSIVEIVVNVKQKRLTRRVRRL